MPLFKSEYPRTVPQYSDALLIEEAHHRFLAANGFRVEDSTAPTYTIKFCHPMGAFVYAPTTCAFRWPGRRR